MSEYEKILRELGSFGPYQRRAFLLVSMFETPLAWAMLTPILLNYKPDFFCPDWDGLHDSLMDNQTDPSLIKQIDNMQSLQWYQMFNNLSTVNLTMKRNECPNNDVCSGIQFDGDIKSIVTQWKLVCDRDHIAERITSIQMGGVLFGAVLTGQLADLFGRRNILFIEHAILVIMWFCSAFAGTWMVYAGLRFIIGGLIGGVLVVNFVLPLELVTPEWRTFCGCIGLWAVGVMGLAGWGYFIRDWQYLVISTSTASVFILLSWWFVPESPRWLLSRGRVKKAERILTAMAKYNKKPVPDFSRLHRAAEAERTMQEQQVKYSYWHLCSSWSLTKNSLILMYAWFVSSSVYYGMSFNTRNLTGDLYLNTFFSGLVEIPALLFVVCVHNILGRRLTVSILMTTAGIFSFFILVLDLIVVVFRCFEFGQKAFGNIVGKKEKMLVITIFSFFYAVFCLWHLDDHPIVITVFALIGKAGISGAWAAVQVFSAEIFPTVVRNIGYAACSFWARIGAIVAPQIVYLGSQEESAPLPFTVFGVIALICGGLVWLLPETRGTPLPDELSKYTTSSQSQNRQDQVENQPEAVPLTDMSENRVIKNGDYQP